MAGSALYSTMVRAGRTTYFVDLKEAKNGHKYLVISQNRIDGETKDRVQIRVMGDTISEFVKAVQYAAAAVTA